MDYKREYEADKKIAEMIFNRHFRSFKQYKDDLIQIAVIRLWQFRTQEFSHYTFTGACAVVRRAMIDFLRPHAKYLNEASLFEKAKDDLLYADILGEDDANEFARMRCQILNKLVNNKIDGLHGKAKDIIPMYLNRRSYAEIARTLGTTKQNIGKYVSRFRNIIAQELEKNCEVTKWNV